MAAVSFAAPVQGHAQDAGIPEAPSAEEPRLALAREIIELGLPPASREQMFFKTMDQLAGQMRASALQNMQTQDDGAIAILDSWLDQWMADSKAILRSHIPALMEGWAAAYATLFTEQELVDIRAFVASPSGAKFMARQSDILATPEFAAANQQYMNAVMKRLPEAQQQLMQELTAYLSEKQAAAEQ